MKPDASAASDALNARNQNMFREVNEAISELGGGFGLGLAGGDPMQVMCECGRPECVERIEVTREEYEHIRSDGTRFLLVAGHEVGTVEHIVERTATYVVAENHGDSERIARDADPRAG